MLYYIFCAIITMMGGFTTCKIVKNQDFLNDTTRYKWANYLSASYAMSWTVSASVGALTYYYGKCLLPSENLLFGVFSLTVLLVVNHLADYKGKYVCKMLGFD